MATIKEPPAHEKRRVKVYELKNNDWFDRGTGFCTGKIIRMGDVDEYRVYVQSEDEPDRVLLESKIVKDDGYQKQQETLIVWTEQGGTDMALSFQEADGCATIWKFVNAVQQHLLSHAPDDALSDDAIDAFATNPLVMPAPEIGNLEDIEQAMRNVATTPQGRDALSKFVICDDYVRKLIPLVEIAEDLESLKDLHLLCNIMKLLILLNDSAIVDHIVSEEIIFGVVGALEYDPDFPHHKASHRKYLQDSTRFKEVVRIADESIAKKIHATWRLTYLKDVVLARILEDPTFGVLNSLIFFNQVDIITYLHNNPEYLVELFGIIDSSSESSKRKKDAVGFIQSCCTIAKSLQPSARASLYSDFVNHGLLRVISFAVLNDDARLRVAGTEILVAMIDHDPGMVRTYILRSVNEKKTPLTDTLIELLLTESDFGVKAQAADAIKVLLEPAQQILQSQSQVQSQQQGQGQDGYSRNGDGMSKGRPSPAVNPQIESYVQHFYDNSAAKLFKPLRDLQERTTLDDLSFHDVQLYTHLIEIIIYLTRTHQVRSRRYLLTENLIARIAQLLTAPQKHLKLIALKFFRSCVGLQDDAYNEHFIQQDLFVPILDIVSTTMHRDNLLNSACLELFEFIRNSNIKSLIDHVVSVHRARLAEITYVDTFHNLIVRCEQLRNPAPPMVDSDMTLFSNDGEAARKRRAMLNGSRWSAAMKDMDDQEQAYFDSLDDDAVDGEEDIEDSVALPHVKRIKMSGPSPISNGIDPAQSAASASFRLAKQLVSYGEDEDDEIDAEGELQQFPPTAADHALFSSSTDGDSTYWESAGSLTAADLDLPAAEQQQQQQQQQQQHDADGATTSNVNHARKGAVLDSSPVITTSKTRSTSKLQPSPPLERLSEKRRREEDDEDDQLGKLSSASSSNKRRVSGPGIASPSPAAVVSAGKADNGREKENIQSSPTADTVPSSEATKSTPPSSLDSTVSEPSNQQQQQPKKKSMSISLSDATASAVKSAASPTEPEHAASTAGQASATPGKDLESVKTAQSADSELTHDMDVDAKAVPPSQPK